MRSTVFAAAASSVAALVEFAGAANASATIDLIWADTGTNEISAVATSSAITLQVILTAGPNGSIGAGVGVDYSAALGTLSVLGFASTPSEGADSPLPLSFSRTTDTGSRVETINSLALSPPFFGTGLSAGQSHQLGTVTFHKAFFISGIFEIQSDVDSPIDGVLDGAGNEIQVDTTFNSAFLVNVVSEPDFDGDGVADNIDNCSERANTDQVDTDLDDCGNLCDADYSQSGLVSLGDFGAFAAAFGSTDPLYQHTPPIDFTMIVGLGDYDFFAQNFNTAPGPSGTTAGTTACP